MLESGSTTPLPGRVVSPYKRTGKLWRCRPRPRASRAIRRCAAATSRWLASLDSARARSEDRVQRFLDAGFELLARAESGKEFTVQEVVDRSGQSLRSFYQYFAGKHELLLALFDEAIRSTADQLEVAGDPAARPARAPRVLRHRVLPHVPARRPRVRVEEQAHPGAGRVLPPAAHRPPVRGRPCVRAARQPAREGPGRRGDAGAVRRGFAHADAAGNILSTIMFNAAYAATISGVERVDRRGRPPEHLGARLDAGILARRPLTRPRARRAGAVRSPGARVPRRPGTRVCARPRP